MCSVWVTELLGSATMRLPSRILLAAAMSCGYSVTLGLLFAAGASGRFSLHTLRLPGVLPVALLVSTVASMAITPVAVWSMATGTRNLWLYAPIFWVALASYDVVVSPRCRACGLYGLTFLALVGLAILRFIPAVR